MAPPHKDQVMPQDLRRGKTLILCNMAQNRDTSKYVLRQGNKIVYVGITNDLERRTAEHEREGMKFTAVDKIGRQTTREAAEDWETARIHQYQENHGGETPMYNQNSSGK